MAPTNRAPFHRMAEVGILRERQRARGANTPWQMSRLVSGRDVIAARRSRNSSVDPVRAYRATAVRTAPVDTLPALSVAQTR